MSSFRFDAGCPAASGLRSRWRRNGKSRSEHGVAGRLDSLVYRADLRPVDGDAHCGEHRRNFGTQLAIRRKARHSIDTKRKEVGQCQKAANNGKKPGFTTIMQLDQIDGVSPRLFRTALRFVTVRSGRPEPDADAASPALRAAPQS